MNTFPYQILILGRGGQGLTFMGELLVRAAHHEGLYAEMLPIYQRTIRGGLMRVSLVIAQHSIALAQNDAFNIGIIMHPTARDLKFPLASEHFLLDAYALGWAQQAQERNFILGLNILVLSYLTQKTKLCSLDTLAWVLKQKLGRKRIQYMPLNLDFLDLGAQNIR